ncbi:MAG: extracellular solute-binding protein [Firmicutes bacterium]|nr:extracellular solute-binding protein [Bacillota bacterium]
MIRKLLASLLTLSMLLVLLVAVGVDAGKKVVIEYWHPYGPPWDELQQMMADLFMKANPDVEIVCKMVPWDSMFQKLAVAVASGTAPAAAHLWGSWQAIAVADMGLTVPLDPYMKKDPTWDPKDVFPAFLEQFHYKGQYVGLPWAAQPTSLCWNKQVFRESGLDPELPPKSLEELEAYASKITLEDSRGKLVRIGFLPQNIWGGFLNWAYHWGGSFYDEKTGKITASDPVNVQALEWQVNFLNKFGGIEEITAWQAGFTGGENDPFILGKLGMMIASHYHYYSFHRYKPDLEYGFARPLLPGPPDRKKGPLAHCDAMVVLKSKNAEYGYKFIKFAVMGEAWLERSKISAHPSPSRRLNKRFIELGLLPKWYPMALWEQNMEVLEIARPHPAIPVIPKLMDELSAQVDLAYRGKKTPRSALKYVDEVVQRELDKNLKKR